MADSSADNTNALDRVYAQALFELAESQEQLAEVADEAAQLSALIGQDSGLAAMLDSRVISTEAKAGFIDRVFAGRVSDTFYRFLRVVNDKGRLPELPGILRGLAELLDDKAGKIEASITVAAPLDSGALEGVRHALSQKLGKDVSVTQNVDESLIGGMVLRIGDELIDGSVATRLQKMKQQMMASGRDKARQLAASL